MRRTGEVLLARSRHDGPEALQLTVSPTNAAGTYGLRFHPEKGTANCTAICLRDSNNQCMPGNSERAWKAFASTRDVPHNAKIMPLTASQPLFITKGDLASGNIPLITKVIMLVTKAFLLFFFSCPFPPFFSTKRVPKKDD